MSGMEGNTVSIISNIDRTKTISVGREVPLRRIFLLRVHSRGEGMKIICMIERNRDILNVDYEDNVGLFRIGSILRVSAPRPVENFLAVGNIPIVESSFPIKLIQRPSYYHEVPLKYQEDKSSPKAFVLHEINLTLSGWTPLVTSCSGLLCDRQRIDEWNNAKNGCGCYKMDPTKTSSIAFQCDIVFHDCFKKKSLKMNKFSSNAFTSLFLSSDISPIVQITQLQLTDTFFELEEKVTAIVKLINEGGGFTVIGWYTRGDVDVDFSSWNEGSSDEKNNASASDGELTFHVTQIEPADSAFLDPTTRLGQSLMNLKFDVSSFA